MISKDTDRTVWLFGKDYHWETESPLDILLRHCGVPTKTRSRQLRLVRGPAALDTLR